MKKKMCPMQFNNTGDGECMQHLCAWWSKYHEACAVHTLNEIPQKLFDILSRILSRE